LCYPFRAGYDSPSPARRFYSGFPPLFGTFLLGFSLPFPFSGGWGARICIPAVNLPVSADKYSCLLGGKVSAPSVPHLPCYYLSFSYFLRPQSVGSLRSLELVSRSFWASDVSPPRETEPQLLRGDGVSRSCHHVCDILPWSGFGSSRPLVPSHHFRPPDSRPGSPLWAPDSGLSGWDPIMGTETMRTPRY
jgi:hypothetical protein